MNHIKFYSRLLASLSWVRTHKWKTLFSQINSNGLMSSFQWVRMNTVPRTRYIQFGIKILNLVTFLHTRTTCFLIKQRKVWIQFFSFFLSNIFNDQCHIQYFFLHHPPWMKSRVLTMWLNLWIFVTRLHSYYTCSLYKSFL